MVGGTGDVDLLDAWDIAKLIPDRRVAARYVVCVRTSVIELSPLSCKIADITDSE